MNSKNSRRLLAFILIIFLFFGGRIQIQSAQSVSSNEEEDTEVEMDPSIERDAQMIMDTLSFPEENRENAVRLANYLRHSGVGPFTSLRIADYAELDIHEGARLSYLLEIVDSAGIIYHVTLNNNCTTYAFFPPDGPGEMVISNEPIY